MHQAIASLVIWGGVVLLCIVVRLALLAFRPPAPVAAARSTFRHPRHRKPVSPPSAASPPSRSRAKPPWVIHALLNLQLHMPKAGCRKLAQAFNQQHGHRVTVGKSFVARCLKQNQQQLWALQRQTRPRVPRPIPINAIWAIDWTFHTTASGQTQTVLGIIDHGSRRLLCLSATANKATWTLLGHLCLAIGRYGKPKAIRTDNESMFTSRLLGRMLAAASIRHQRTPLHCPWQNGRIERLFRTLKPVLRSANPCSPSAWSRALNEFKAYYNHIRTHDHLGGRTPVQAWSGITWADMARCPPKAVIAVQALGGLCTGYYIRR